MNEHNNSQNFISIIIPVYNTSLFLRQCIDSAINQTLREIEIILINDCSPDPLDDEICTQYASKDDRVKYIQHTQNLGSGGARNSGLKVSSGKYIWFIDSDDFIDINACEFLYRLTEKTNADIIAFSATSHVNGDLDLSSKSYYHYKRGSHILDRIMTGKEFMTQSMAYDSFHVSPCLHLFKNSLISQYQFRESVIHEDADLIPIIIYSADSVFCTKYAPYYRLLRENSITQKEISVSSMLDKFAAVNSLLKYTTSFEKLENDPFVKFSCAIFNDIKQLYENFGAKTQQLDNEFAHLTDFYDERLGEVKNLSASTTQDIRKKLLHLERELSTLKSSRFWKLLQVVKRLGLYKQ